MFEHPTGLQVAQVLADVAVPTWCDGVAGVFLGLGMLEAMHDTFGHTAADAVLVEFARRRGATLRTRDTLCRLAGDESVIDGEGARTTAQRP